MNESKNVTATTYDETPSSDIKLKRGDRLKIHIDRLAVGGRGVGRHGKLVVFVPETAPQEEVEIELTQVKKNFAEAKLVKITTASPHRRQPLCAVFGECGGCNWQHVTYEEQLHQKHQLVEQALRRISGAEIKVEPVTPCQNEFRYRNRIQLNFMNSKMGFFKRGSHDVVDISDCPITERSITNHFQDLKKKFAAKGRGRIEAFVDQKDHFQCRTVFSEANTSHEPESLTSDFAGPAFSQVNTSQNKALIANLVREVTTLTEMKAPAIYDLYAGSGNFTFPLGAALPEAKIVAVELNSESVRLARTQLESSHKFRNIDFNQGDVRNFLEDHRLVRNSVVVLDPPRSGCAPQVVTELRKQSPKWIFYISCHPVTLARDLKHLIESSDRPNDGSKDGSRDGSTDSEGPGYDLVRVQPFDMFPQTDHVETLTILRLRS